MDEILEAKFTELKRVVVVPDGMNPLTNIHDALKLAQDNSCLYVYAQNGSNYEVRWTEDSQPLYMHEVVACVVVVDHIIEVMRGRAQLPETVSSTVTESGSTNRRRRKSG